MAKRTATTMRELALAVLMGAPGSLGTVPALADLMNLELEGEGDRGFALLWIIRAFEGRALPFGPVVSYAADSAGTTPEFYAALFGSDSFCLG